MPQQPPPPNTPGGSAFDPPPAQPKPAPLPLPLERVEDPPEILEFTIEFPVGCKNHHIEEARGLIYGAATSGIDWEKLHNNEEDAISPTSKILLEIAHRLPA